MLKSQKEIIIALSEAHKQERETFKSLVLPFERGMSIGYMMAYEQSALMVGLIVLSSDLFQHRLIACAAMYADDGCDGLTSADINGGGESL